MAFKQHELYMGHQAIAKWQKAPPPHARCFDTFQDGDLAIETGFTETYYTHQSHESGLH